MKVTVSSRQDTGGVDIKVAETNCVFDPVINMASTVQVGLPLPHH